MGMALLPDPSDPQEQFYFQVSAPEAPLVKLSSGADFPERVSVLALPAVTRPHGDIALILDLRVEDDEPQVDRIVIGRAGKIRAETLHDLRWGWIIDHAIAAVAAAVRLDAEAQLLGRRRGPWHLELEGADFRIRTAPRRNEPVSEEDLREVADIVKENDYDPRQAVAQRLHVSLRTASRRIAEARRRGFLEGAADGTN